MKCGSALYLKVEVASGYTHFITSGDSVSQIINVELIPNPNSHLSEFKLSIIYLYSLFIPS